MIGAGTDAHRVSTYNPFTVLQWFLDGRNAGGTPLRGPAETPTRADALRFYTAGSAWVSHDEDERGTLEVGKMGRPGGAVERLHDGAGRLRSAASSPCSRWSAVRSYTARAATRDFQATH